MPTCSDRVGKCTTPTDGDGEQPGRSGEGECTESDQVAVAGVGCSTEAGMGKPGRDDA